VINVAHRAGFEVGGYVVDLTLFFRGRNNGYQQIYRRDLRITAPGWVILISRRSFATRSEIFRGSSSEGQVRSSSSTR
jgi:hypothetical protein